MNFQKGEVSTFLTVAALVLVGVSTLVSSAVLKSKLTTSTKASAIDCFFNPDSLECQSDGSINNSPQPPPPSPIPQNSCSCIFSSKDNGYIWAGDGCVPSQEGYSCDPNFPPQAPKCSCEFDDATNKYRYTGAGCIDTQQDKECSGPAQPQGDCLCLLNKTVNQYQWTGSSCASSQEGYECKPQTASVQQSCDCRYDSNSNKWIWTGNNCVPSQEGYECKPYSPSEAPKCECKYDSSVNDRIWLGNGCEPSREGNKCGWVNTVCEGRSLNDPFCLNDVELVTCYKDMSSISFFCNALNDSGRCNTNENRCTVADNSLGGGNSPSTTNPSEPAPHCICAELAGKYIFSGNACGQNLHRSCDPNDPGLYLPRGPNQNNNIPQSSPDDGNGGIGAIVVPPNDTTLKIELSFESIRQACLKIPGVVDCYCYNNNTCMAITNVKPTPTK